MRLTRKRFDHLVVELSLAVGERIPRYALWLHLHDQGLDPERLARREVESFCLNAARPFLSEHGFTLSKRASRRLFREIARFDPTRITPEEHMARIGGGSV